MSKDNGYGKGQGRKRQARPHDACILDRLQSVTGTWARWFSGHGGPCVAHCRLYALLTSTYDTMNALSLQKRPESEISLRKNPMVAVIPVVYGA